MAGVRSSCGKKLCCAWGSQLQQAARDRSKGCELLGMRGCCMGAWGRHYSMGQIRGESRGLGVRPHIAPQVQQSVQSFKSTAHLSTLG